MRVLMINSVCGIRSTGRICTDLAAELEKQGHEVKIAYGRESVPEQFERFAVRIGSDFDVKLHGVKARFFDAMGYGSKKATERFIEWVKEYDPDVIHLHNIHGYYINIEILFKYLKTCGKRIIWTLHDCWAFTGHSAYCDAIDCTRWKTGCHDCPQKKVYPKSLTDHSEKNWRNKKDLFTGIPDLTIVTPSHWLEGLVKDSFLSEYRVEVIYNGVDTSVFKPTQNKFRNKNDLADKHMVLGATTSWTEMKGYSDFLALSEKLPDEYQVVMIGLTEKQLEKLPHNIMGVIRTESVYEMADIYSSADVFVNLTYCDSFGLVNIESVLCGTPVVSYHVGGCPESVCNNGILVEKGNVDAALRAITSLCTNPIELCIDRYSCDNMMTINNYLKLF